MRAYLVLDDLLIIIPATDSEWDRLVQSAPDTNPFAGLRFMVLTPGTAFEDWRLGRKHSSNADHPFRIPEEAKA